MSQGDIYRASQWLQGAWGLEPGDVEWIELVPNEVMDAQGPFHAYPKRPTYEGQELPAELFYIDLT